MEKEETKTEVKKWLESIYGTENIPEIPQDSLDQLSNLMKIIQEEERNLQIAAELQKSQIADYKSETENMKAKLENLGFEKQRSPQDSEINNLINDLAQTSELLGLDDPSEFSLNLAISDLRKKVAHAPLDSYLNKVKSDKAKKALLDDIALLNKTEQALNMSKTEASIDEENIAQTRKKFHFMLEKEKEYVKLQDKYVAAIRKSGYDKSSTHESILNLKKTLDGLLEEKQPLVEKLEAYKGLPASLELAMAELADKEEVLRKLKERLQNEVQKIHL